MCMGTCPSFIEFEHTQQTLPPPLPALACFLMGLLQFYYEIRLVQTSLNFLQIDDAYSSTLQLQNLILLYCIKSIVLHIKILSIFKLLLTFT